LEVYSSKASFGELASGRSVTIINGDVRRAIVNVLSVKSFTTLSIKTEETTLGVLNGPHDVLLCSTHVAILLNN
jgi:hypothetical protein